MLRSATGNHPIWAVCGDPWDGKAAECQGPNRQGHWLEAKDLEAGKTLLSMDGHEPITALESTRGQTVVFNIEVAGHHNYFVGNQGLLVHNKADVNRKGGGKTGRNSNARRVESAKRRIAEPGSTLDLVRLSERSGFLRTSTRDQDSMFAYGASAARKCGELKR